MNLTKRHKDILRAALGYAHANVDDLNDALAHFTDDGWWPWATAT
jgi:hypothetical protein